MTQLRGAKNKKKNASVCFSNTCILFSTLWTTCFRTNSWKIWDEYIVSGSISRRLMMMFVSHPFPQVMILGCSPKSNHQRAGNPPSQRSCIFPSGPPLLCRQPLQTGQGPEPGRSPQRPQRRQPHLCPLPRNRRRYEAGSGEYVGVRNIER